MAGLAAGLANTLLTNSSSDSNVSRSFVDIVREEEGGPFKNGSGGRLERFGVISKTQNENCDSILRFADSEVHSHYLKLPLGARTTAVTLLETQLSQRLSGAAAPTLEPRRGAAKRTSARTSASTPPVLPKISLQEI